MMALLLTEAQSTTKGYSAMVDYWSLAVTMYKLLTGKMPFHNTQINSFVDYISKSPDERIQSMPTYVQEYACFLKGLLSVTALISADIADIITQFLQIDYRTRLGYGRDGAKEIKGHQFFRSIDWNKLAQKHMVPPYIPSGVDEDSTNKPTCSSEPLFESFVEMILAVRKREWVF